MRWGDVNHGDGDLTARWYEVAERLALRECGIEASAVDRQTFSAAFWPLVVSVETALGTAGGKWDDAVSAKVVEAHMRTSRGVDGSLSPKAGSRLVVIVRALRIAHAAVTRDLSAVGPYDALWAARLLGDGLAHQAERRTLLAHPHASDRSDVPSDAHEVPFAFPFLPPLPRGNTHGSALRGEGTLRLESVDGASAPVAAVLAPSVRHGRPIEVRRFGDALYRPALSPGGWTPLDVPAFAEALSGRDGWRDDPTRTPHEDMGPALSVREITVEPVKDAPSVAAARHAAREAAVSRAGRLLVIDGIVHRATEPPRMTLVSVTEGGGRARFETGWTMGRLRSWSTEEAANLRRDAGPRYETLTVPGGMRLPVLDAAAHADLARTWEGLMTPDRKSPSGDRIDVVTSAVAPVTLVDHAALGHDPEDLLGPFRDVHPDGPDATYEDATAHVVRGVLDGYDGALDHDGPTPRAVRAFVRAYLVCAARRWVADRDAVAEIGALSL